MRKVLTILTTLLLLGFPFNNVLASETLSSNTESSNSISDQNSDVSIEDVADVSESDGSDTTVEPKNDVEKVEEEPKTEPTTEIENPQTENQEINNPTTPETTNDETTNNVEAPVVEEPTKEETTKEIESKTDVNSTIQSTSIQTFSASQVTESTTSKLGRILTTTAKIYPTIGNDQTAFAAGSKYTDKVFYIKKQATYNKTLYYLISTVASSTTGVIGWVKASDMWAQNHVAVDHKSKTFYLKGSGWAYAHAWGAGQDTIYKDLSDFKNQKFTVNLTEKVGDAIWYRGYLENGQKVWIQAYNVTTKVTNSESATSKLGRILTTTAKIYPSLGNGDTAFAAGTKYTDKIFYIKKQATYNGTLYYLISTVASSTNGVIGWVKANDMWAQNHVAVDHNSKTFYLKGSGWAYAHAWGAGQDTIYKDLTQFTNQKFSVNLTEKVGNAIWYRGYLENGQKVWIQAYNVSTTPVITESNTSKLGRILTTTANIYPTLGNGKTAIVAGTKYTDKVFYIKKQATYNGTLYYLISTVASSTTGVIGWVKASDMWAQNHVAVDHNVKNFYLKGTGWAYAHAWGAGQDAIYKDLSSFKGQLFEVNLTEKVGDAIWYRGYLENGQKVWIQAYNVNTTYQNNTNYSLTLSEALAIQMKANPQTDKYRNEPAYVSTDSVNITGTVNANVNLRTSTSLKDNSNVSTTISSGTTFRIIGTVQGDSFNGSTKWYKIQYNSKTLYVHSTLVNITSAVTESALYVRDAESYESHIYDTVSKGTSLIVLDVGNEWLKIQYTTWRNATSSDVSYYLNPKNFVNDEKLRFQFLDLSKSSSVSASVLNTFLSGKGTLNNMGQAFIDAGKKYNVNEIYLLSHALLETGQGTSPLAKGYSYNGVTVYNMYGIGAYDGTALTSGAKYAYEHGWTTPYIAIVEGAKFIAEQYIHSSNNQNTLYKMRWNPEYMARYGGASHQYATDIGWAVKQIDSIYNIYRQLDSYTLYFDIPTYK
ncbi:N-acetylglucosaminidase [Ureibacillus sp. FSL E2-3493]|uniref:N-acetylglucosaminidase n=1 Tax=Ureibacillus sp. FSL E2-3493 TaxID=2921367 RepID=UPI003119FE59